VNSSLSSRPPIILIDSKLRWDTVLHPFGSTKDTVMDAVVTILARGHENLACMLEKRTPGADGPGTVLVAQHGQKPYSIQSMPRHT